MCKFMNLVPYLPVVLSGGGTSPSLTNLLGYATELWTWFLSSMGTLITFIFSNAFMFIGFLIFICGSVVAMFMRIFHSV